MKKAVLPPDVKLINPDGTPTQVFYEFLQNLSKNGLGQGVTTTAPTNGQKLQYVAATGLWTPV